MRRDPHPPHPQRKARFQALALVVLLATSLAGCTFADESSADAGDEADDSSTGGVRWFPNVTTGRGVSNAPECEDEAIQAANVSLTHVGQPEDLYSPDGLRVTLSVTPCNQPPNTRFETGLMVPDGVEIVATVTSAEGTAARNANTMNVTSIVRADAPGEYVLTGVAALVDDDGSNYGILHSYAYLGIRGDAQRATAFQPERSGSSALLDEAARGGGPRTSDGRNASAGGESSTRATPLRIVAMGDIGVGPNATANLEGSLEDGAEAFIGLGDYYYWAPPEEWLDLFEPLLNDSAYLAIGNHDNASDMSPWFDDGTAWSHELGGARVVALDTTQNATSFSRQHQWARAELCDAEEPLRILVMHAPWWLGSEALHPASEFPGSPDAMDDLVDDCGVDLVLTSHEHNYQRYVRGDAQYLIVGTGGESIYPVLGAPEGTVATLEEYGRLILDVSPDGYEAMFRTMDGETLDRFEGAAEP